MADVTDDFNRADGGLGSNWTTKINALSIVSNQVTLINAANVDAAAVWNANTFSSNHYSQFKITDLSVGGVGAGPSVRMQSSDNSWYAFFFDTGGTVGYMLKIIGGSSNITQVGSNYTLALVASDVLKLDATGSVLTPSVNGAPLTTQTDATLTSGSPGLHLFGTTAQVPDVDDWLGGPIVTTGSTVEAAFNIGGGHVRRRVVVVSY